MLQLPATPAQVLAQVIVPVYQHLLPAKFGSDQASVILLAIALQESGLRTRQQMGGPARSLWQEEQGGGVHAVLNNPATRIYMRGACSLLGIAPIESDIYAALLSDDQAGCVVARLILWADPQPLPAIGDVDGAWIAYSVRDWRPGKPKPDTWAANYAAAQACIAGVSA
ncbi:MAG: hypothetical protein WAM90_15735 [Rhodanobacter sp.]